MKIIITGTHFTPAQAVIEKLKKLDPRLEIVYLGRKHTLEGDQSLSVESQIIPTLGVKFIPIISGRLQRSLGFYTFPSLFKIPIGFIQSFFVLLQEKPNVILSFGGYTAVPVVISAWLLSIPIIIHEQTLVSGLANRISAWFADKIAISFKQNTDFDSKKTVFTGNPIRSLIGDGQHLNPEIRKIVESSKKEKKPLILVMGGNQGSHIINQTIGGNLAKLTSQYCLIHQTGRSKFNDFEQLTETAKKLKINKNYYLPLVWINETDLGYVMEHLSLAITRAGINTLMELASFKVPSVIVPIEGHFEQNTNAKFFSELGLGKVVRQSEFKREKIPDVLQDIVKEFKDRKLVSGENLIVKDASSRVALETILLAQTAQ